MAPPDTGVGTVCGGSITDEGYIRKGRVAVLVLHPAGGSHCVVAAEDEVTKYRTGIIVMHPAAHITIPGSNGEAVQGGAAGAFDHVVTVGFVAGDRGYIRDDGFLAVVVVDIAAQDGDGWRGCAG